MKTKKITIPVPSKYKWMAIQPYGDLTLFTVKPCLDNNGDWFQDGKVQRLLEWYKGNKDDFDIHLDLPYNENWRKTLKRI